MVKRAILLLSAAVSFSGAGMAQTAPHCYTNEVLEKLTREYPDIARYEAQLEQDIQRKLQGMDLRRFAKTTADDTIYHVPLVFHIIHDYGTVSGSAEYISDNAVYQCVADINKMYSRQNADTSDVIAQYRGSIPGTDVRYIGKANIRFHLATKDPAGNPTNGVTRHRSYLTSNAGDQAKLDLWPPDAYVNIWVVRRFNSAQSQAAAYAYKPPSAAANPYGDGVIALYNYVNSDNTISHELGHVFNLDHPWGATNNCEIDCGDDGVDDTPPTKGHCPDKRCTAPALYDTACTNNLVIIGRTGIPSNLIPKPTVSSILGIEFVARQNLTIDSLVIYPTDTIGAPFTILLRHYGDVVDSFAGTVTSNVGAQTVPVDFSVPADSGYVMVFRRNPGALRDTIITSYSRNIPGAITLKNDNDNQYYNFFYGWFVRYGSSAAVVGKPSLNMTADRLTNVGIAFKAPTRISIDSVDIYPTDTVGAPFAIVLQDAAASNAVRATYNGVTTTTYGLQKVPVGFDVPAGANYRMVFTTNPGALRDTPTIGYTKSVPHAIEVSSDLDASGKYNYFYNWRVRYGYFKVYPSRDTSKHGADSLVNYPDTVNAQNVMDYTYCSKMFTHGQTERMRAALTSSVAGRSNLISSNNLKATGALVPRADLPPVADFSVKKTNVTLADRMSVDKVFGCADGTSIFGFDDRSWNDTIIGRSWTFSNGEYADLHAGERERRHLHTAGLGQGNPDRHRQQHRQHYARPRAQRICGRSQPDQRSFLFPGVQPGRGRGQMAGIQLLQQ